MGLISRVSSRTYRRATAGLSLAKMVHSSELFSVRVGNEIPERTNEDDLRDKFEKYGKIGDVFIPKERGSDRGRGFAFIRFYEKRDMEDCLDELKADGIDLDGANCKVEYARPRDPDYNRRWRRRIWRWTRPTISIAISRPRTRPTGPISISRPILPKVGVGGRRLEFSQSNNFTSGKQSTCPMRSSHG